ncbi:erythromycin esterase family protein [Asticcacaulis sp. 201]|uniref:erythromycin esterase family protein n=1 Tax=Asticcacaulis sp. 201 TaxID=3028787 RepID=UPI002916C79A|nr:erythromycin esterase family protein [Asticcacaulis sp. 201]MDV6329995.1 erythromycin esterase family protein [Asticcacaulis sp. 201]
MSLLFALIATVTVAASPTPTPEDEAAAVAWFKVSGHALSGADASAEDLAPIAERLSAGRVIGLGEATHGGHEDQLFKANLIKQLVRAQGVTVVVLEANRDAARDFDTYIRTGVGDPMTLMRSTSFFRAGRDEEFAGLLVWLRAWNQVATRPVRIIGIDNQDAARDAAFALDFVRKHDARLADRLAAPFASLLPSPGQPWPHAFTWIQAHTTADIAAVQTGAQTLKEAIAVRHAEWSGDPAYAEALYAADIAWQCLHQFEREGKDSATEFVTDGYFARRDVFMAQNLMARLDPADKAVIWAHAGHVMNWLPDSYVKSGYSTLGRELKGRLGDAYTVLGATFTTGRIMTVAERNGERPSSAAPESVVSVPNDGPRDIGRLLAALPGDAAWIDLTLRPKTPALNRWVLSDYNYGWAGWAVKPEDWQKDAAPPADKAMPFDKGFDVMIWFRHITPARRLPEAKSLAQ